MASHGIYNYIYVHWRIIGFEKPGDTLLSDTSEIKAIHDARAPYWAAGLVILCSTGLATIWLDWGSFWKGYVLDMTGPAWNYILVRGLFTEYHDNAWTRFFTPLRTLILFILLCFGVETMQYLEWYDATFDPWDLPAYVSILVPLSLIDLRLQIHREKR